MSTLVQERTKWTATGQIPPLENGDLLTAEEYDRRYEAMPDVRAQLIEGRVYIMASPVSPDFHGEPHADLIGWLVLYRTATKGVKVGDNTTLRLDLKNRPQPDAYLRVLPEFGGLAQKDGKYIRGAVELVAEVSASSVTIDLNDKLTAYERNGVREYIVWRIQDDAIDWFILRDGKYEPLPPGDDSIHRSRVFPGLWLDVAAMIAGNMERVAEVARLGLTSPDHAAFVAELQARVGQ